VAEQQTHPAAGATRLAERPAQPGTAAAANASSTSSTKQSTTTPVTGTKPIPYAAVSFVSGLVGLLVANLLLGPLAIVLGAMGLRSDTKNRRFRAALGIVLGVADIAVFFLLAAHSGSHHGSLNWNFFSN
jgi:predicted lipid-binding transport protein (Tim44 family)